MLAYHVYKTAETHGVRIVNAVFRQTNRFNMWSSLAYAIPLCLHLVLALAGRCVAATDRTQVIYSYPESPFTDIENIAVRSNGQLLLNYITSPSTYLLDVTESSPSPQLLYTFPDATSTVGIAEVTPDIFAIVVGNYSTATFQGTLGSFSVWTINLTNGVPGIVKKVASIPQAKSLNGATVLASNPNVVLVADSALGSIWSVNIDTGASSQVIQNDLLNASSTFPLGINGIKTRGKTLYFTNSAQKIFGSVPISDTLGTATGPVETIATLPANLTAYDDFALDGAGNAWVATHPSTLLKISPSGEQSVVGGPDLAVFNDPTSAAFGRGSEAQKCLLYVVTAGENGKTSGQVVAVNTC